MRVLRVFFVTMIFTIGVFASVAHAVIVDVGIHQARVRDTLTGARVQFMLTSGSKESQDVHYGIMYKNIDDKTAQFERKLGHVILYTGRPHKVTELVSKPTTLGKYQVFIVTKDAKGLVGAFRYIGTVVVTEQSVKAQLALEQKNASTNARQDMFNKLGSTSTGDDIYRAQVRLTRCKYNAPELATSTGSITCAVSSKYTDTVPVHYILTRGSQYGDELSTGQLQDVPVVNDVVTIPIKEHLKPGSYTYTLWTYNEMETQQVIVNIPRPKARAGHGTTTFHTNITADDGKSNMIFGMQRELAIFVALAAAALLIIIIVVIIFIHSRKKSKNKRAIDNTALFILAFALLLPIIGIAQQTRVFLLANTSSNPNQFNNTSRDAPTTQFQISFPDEVATGAPIDVSYVFQQCPVSGSCTSQKPPGGSITYSLDGGAEQTLVASSDADAYGVVQIPAINDGGTHTYTFRSPDRCYSAFAPEPDAQGNIEYGSHFYATSSGLVSYFGTHSCQFDLVVNVTDNHPPTAPDIDGFCMVGKPCDIYFVSTDPDNDDICYDVTWPDNTSPEQKCNTSGTPIAHQYTIVGACTATSTAVSAVAIDAKSAQSPVGYGGVDVPDTITCVEKCDHCVVDGGSMEIALSADPRFIVGSGTTTIAWTLKNVKTCAVRGVDVASGDTVADWQWDTVRTHASMPITLSGATRFTLTCSDENDAEQTETLVITNRPDWRER